MVVKMFKYNMANAMIKTLEGSAVTQTVLGGLNIYPNVANLLQCICVKMIKKKLAASKQLLQK